MPCRKSSIVRELLKRETTQVKPGTFNAMPAMVVEKAGFKCSGITGYSMSPHLLLARLNEPGIAMLDNATRILRTGMVRMWDYVHEVSRDEIEAVKSFEVRTNDRPAGNLHAFIGFPELKKYEEERLPAVVVLMKHEGAAELQL